MYDYIKGTVASLSPTRVVVEAAGVGYDIAISLETFSALEHATTAKVFVQLIVREDAQLLYGFATEAERELFRLLVSVSGVGPNTARTILSTYAPAELQRIIAAQDAALLKHVKGLGLKTAQKIIVELSGKTGGAGAPLSVAAGSGPLASGAYEEAVAALTMLGFQRAASEKALQAIFARKPDCPVEEAVRLALKQL